MDLIFNDTLVSLTQRVSPNAGSRRSQTCQAPGVLALREHIRRAVLR